MILRTLTLCLALFVITFPFKTSGQNFSPADIGLLPAGFETITLWIDIDNDGDQDAIIGGGTQATGIYKNNGGILDLYSSNLLPALLHPIFGAGDFNKDGSIDLIVSGVVSGGDDRSILGGGIYFNNGFGYFTLSPDTQFAPLKSGTASCGDFDLDGDVDILMMGSDFQQTPQTVILMNDRGSFSPLSHELPGVVGSSGRNASWGDYDRDGDLDILLSGEKPDGNSPTGVLAIYINNGDRTFKKSQGNLPQFRGKAEWVDLNSDGWLDFFVTGYQAGSSVYSKFYNNDNGSFKEGVALDTEAPFQDFILMDFDNDGDKDMLTTSSFRSTVAIYTNNAGTSFSINNDVTLPAHGNISAADYDGDGDADILLSGYTDTFTGSTKAFSNNSSLVNQAPSAPTNLTATISVAKLSFSWSASTDSENSSAALSYFLKVGTSPGASDVISSLTTMIPSRGIKLPLNDLSQGTYYATLQAVDLNGNKSSSSNEVTFTVIDLINVPIDPANLKLAITPDNFVSITWIDQSFNEDQFSIERSEDSLSFQVIKETGKNAMNYVDKTVVPGKKYFYRIKAVNASGPSAYIATQPIMNPKGLFTRLDAFHEIQNRTNSSVSVAWVDYDSDGFDDLFSSVYGRSNLLYRNKGDGSFEQIQSESGDLSIEQGQNRRSCWGDYDNDGDQDVFIPTSSKGRLFNNVNGVFTEVTGVPFDESTTDTYGVSWVDYDNDGFLDLSVLYYQAPSNLFHNNGDGTFSKVTTGVFVEDSANFVSISWCDYNNDGWSDALAINYGGDLILYKNNQGKFERVNDPIVKSGTGAVGASWGDYDNDGDFDVFIAHNTGMDLFYENNGDGSFSVESNEIINFEFKSSSSSWGDIDNDGNIDLVQASAGKNGKVAFNKGNGSFTLYDSEPSLQMNSYPESVALSDYNNDGLLDIAFAGWNMDNLVLKNNGNNKGNHWATFRLKGTNSNRNAIGAKVSVTTGGVTRTNFVTSQTGYSSQNSFNVHFGLGNSSTIDSLVVEWPTRGHQILLDVAADQFLNIVEPDFHQPPVLNTVTYTATQRVKVDWADQPNVTRYVVERSIGSRYNFKRVSVVDNLSEYSENPQVEFDSVFYRVTALKGNNASSYSNIKGIFGGLLSPTDAKVILDVNKNKVTWTDKSQHETGYEVYRSVNKEPFQSVGVSLSANAIQYIDGNITEQTDFYYTIRAVNGVGTSSFSDTVLVSVPLFAPGDLTVSLGESITLKWADRSQKETSYSIERSQDDNQHFVAIGSVSPNVTTFSDNSFEPSKNLFYRVQAKSATTVSAYSAEVTTLVLAVEDKNDNYFQVYPNPAKGMLNIKAPAGEKHLQLTNAIGTKVIATINTNEGIHLDVTDLSAGLYILSIGVGDKQIHKRIQIEN